MEEISFNNKTFKFIFTPGHASHHMSILLLPNKVMFTGDSAGVILDIENKLIQVPTTPPIFKPKLYLESINKMTSINPKPLFIAPTHFGMRKPFYELIEKHRNQVIRWLETVSRTIERGVEDVNEIIEILTKKDTDVKTIMQSKTDFLKKEFVINSILGVIDAIKRGEWP